MKHVLKVLNAFIESKVREIESKDERIKELWREVCKLEAENISLEEKLSKKKK